MKPRIFVSTKSRGWEEIQIPDFYKRYTYEALVSIVHKFIDRKAYKGLLITENPDPFREQLPCRLRA